MAAISGTTVQKTLKLEATTLFARASVAGALGVPTTLTADGASKGVTITKIGSGIYQAAIDSSIPVKQFLGASTMQVRLQSNTAGLNYQTRAYAEDAAAGTISFIIYEDGGGVTNAPDGGELQFTIFLTTSPVF